MTVPVVHVKPWRGWREKNDLLVVLEERTGYHQSHYVGIMKVWTELHNNTSKSCWDSSVWTKVGGDLLIDVISILRWKTKESWEVLYHSDFFFFFSWNQIVSEGKHVIPGNYFNTANMLTKDNIQVHLLACYFCTYKDNRNFLAVKESGRRV